MHFSFDALKQQSTTEKTEATQMKNLFEMALQNAGSGRSKTAASSDVGHTNMQSAVSNVTVVQRDMQSSGNVATYKDMQQPSKHTAISNTMSDNPSTCSKLLPHQLDSTITVLNTRSTVSPAREIPTSQSILPRPPPAESKPQYTRPISGRSKFDAILSRGMTGVSATVVIDKLEITQGTSTATAIKQLHVSATKIQVMKVSFKGKENT